MGKITSRGIRCNIVLVGRRNAGKSTLLNAICGQQVALTSTQPGTTTDPVVKAYELLPFGPVSFFDTAGLDDDDASLGDLRTSATWKVIRRADLIVLVCGEDGFSQLEVEWTSKFIDKNIPLLIVLNKADLTGTKITCLTTIGQFYPDLVSQFKQIPAIQTSALEQQATDSVKDAIISTIPPACKEDMPLVSDLLLPGQHLLCIIPIDSSAPKGRLILPQVQVLREALDADCLATIVKENRLTDALAKTTPALIVTDSQVVKTVVQTIPADQPVTTFSILFARNKGDLSQLIAGAEYIDKLRDNDQILIAESCSHHAQDDDIGRVKIPNLLYKYTGKQLTFNIYSGHDLPDDLDKYALAIHCGACMTTRRDMLNRLAEFKRVNLPVTNFGVAISHCQGVLSRVTAVFNKEK